MQYRHRTHQQNWVPKEVNTPAGDLDTDGVGVKLMVGVMLGVTVTLRVTLMVDDSLRDELGVQLMDGVRDTLAVWVASQN